MSGRRPSKRWGRGVSGESRDQSSAVLERAAVRRPGTRKRIGVGLIGFGWLGRAHSRSLRRIPTLFAERDFEVELVICAD